MKIEASPRGDYIQGEFVPVEDPNGEVASRNPGDLEQPALKFPFCFQHVQEAVEAARRSFSTWRRTTTAQRQQVIKKYRDLLKQRGPELAQAISWEIGKPLWESRQEIQETLDLIDYNLELGYPAELNIDQAEKGCQGSVRFLPRGVMAVITPATVPVYASHFHFLPALLHGDTVVLKSSKLAPWVGQLLAEIVHDSGMPAGVMNLLQGDAELGRRLVCHSEVDGVLFTGSFETGAKIQKQTLSDFGKLVVLDTGGKNAMVIWDDCDYQRALSEAIYAGFLTSGQRCTSTSRIIVHDSLLNRFIEDLHTLAKKSRVDYALKDGKDAALLGPLVNEDAMENYLRFQGIAVREGAEEIMRGKPLERVTKGYYISPSIHHVDTPDAKSVYQTTEIYGPNLAVYSASDIEQAAEIINLTKQGLVASIYTQSRENFLRLGDEAQVGLLHWNRPTTSTAFRLPYGGIKESGNSRPMGSYAWQQCTYQVSSLEWRGNEEVAPLAAPLPKLEG